VFTGVFTLGSKLPSGFGVMLSVFTALRSCSDPRQRRPVKTAGAEWCQPVFVLKPAELALDA
jgi:hypothetical protein